MYLEHLDNGKRYEEIHAIVRFLKSALRSFQDNLGQKREPRETSPDTSAIIIWLVTCLAQTYTRYRVDPRIGRNNEIGTLTTRKWAINMILWDYKIM